MVHGSSKSSKLGLFRAPRLAEKEWEKSPQRNAAEKPWKSKAAAIAAVCTLRTSFAAGQLLLQSCCLAVTCICTGFLCSACDEAAAAAPPEAPASGGQWISGGRGASRAACSCVGIGPQCISCSRESKHVFGLRRQNHSACLCDAQVFPMSINPPLLLCAHRERAHSCYISIISTSAHLHRAVCTHAGPPCQGPRAETAPDVR
jgi:hypothetical protein